MTTTGTAGAEDSGGQATGGGNGPGPYALRLSVDYPDRELDRLSSALRLFWVIPIIVVLGGISGYAGNNGFTAVGISTASLIVFAPALMIIFRQKYPRWWWDFNIEFMRFQARIGMYFFLTTDTYPSTDEEQSVHLEADYPDVVNDLNRWMPIVKWLLAIPHYIVLFFLWIGLLFVLIYVWVVIIFTARYPRGAFDYIVGVNRWSYRVQAYAFLLNTDDYPPFSLD